jgi:hypothetical protein
MLTSADAAERRAIAQQSQSSSSTAAPPASASNGSGSSSSSRVSSQARSAVQSGDAQQVQAYVEQHPQEAEAVYEELLRTDPAVLYELERRARGSVPQAILAQTDGPDLSAEMAEVKSQESAGEQAIALNDVVLDVKAQYGIEAATEFAADYIRSNPQAFAEGYVVADQANGGTAHELNQIFADALSRVYENTPTVPYGYSSPYSFAKSLIDGTFAGQGGTQQTAMSSLIGMSGNDALRSDFVTAGLYRGMFEVFSDPSGGVGQVGANGRGLIQTLWPAIDGSSDAAAAVIRFAEDNPLGDSTQELNSAGVESLRWLADIFGAGGYEGTQAWFAEYETTAPPDLQAAADRVMDAGDHDLWADDDSKRMDVFAEELGKGDADYGEELIALVLEKDDGAFDSWISAGRIESLADSGRISAEEAQMIRESLANGLDSGRMAADRVPASFVADTHDPALIASYMNRQDLNDGEGIERAIQAFAGLRAEDIGDFINDADNAALMREFSMEVQRQQDRYENMTVGTINPNMILPWLVYDEPPVQFSEEQLVAMREAFQQSDGMYTSGELLLAFPDRIERNEAVTQQYHDLSQGMAGIVGADNANWATFAVWASDEIGRNLDGHLNRTVEMCGAGDPRFWLSKGNSALVSDIGPAFNHFVDTFGGGANRDMSFDQFWTSFEAAYGGRGISYLDGQIGSSDDMKNAFKAYYDAMRIEDQLRTNPANAAELDGRRDQLMLYGNTLVGLQEQYLVQSDIENGLTIFGMENPLNVGGNFIDFHLPDGQGGTRRLDTNSDLQPAADAVSPLDEPFVTWDGQTIDLGDELRTRLNNLDGVPGNEDETDIGNSGVSGRDEGWQQYAQRMGYIYHLFANYQRDPSLFQDPRDVVGSRSEPLDTEPEPYQLPAMGMS